MATRIVTGVLRCPFHALYVVSRMVTRIIGRMVTRRITTDWELRGTGPSRPYLSQGPT